MILDKLEVEGLEEADAASVAKEASKRGVWLECCTIEATNWTPWWGGDYEAKVRDPETLEPTSAPTSETLKGVTRWILRLALAAALGGGGHDTLDEALAPVYGGAARRGRSEEHLDSLVRIRVEASVVDDSSIARRALQEVGSRRRISEGIYQRLGRKARGEAEAYAKIATVSRYVLLTMASDEEERLRKRASMLPVAPDHVRVTVGIDIRRAPPYPYALLCRLTSYAVLYALEVRGLGRGSTRGFGRFKVKGVRCSLGPSLQEEFKRLAEDLLDPQRIPHALQRVHEILTGLAHDLSRRLGLTEPPGGLMVPPLRHVESPREEGVVARLIRGASHPWPAPTTRRPPRAIRVRDVYDALSAIGASTLKASWKNRAGIGITRPGVGLHTWLLGLPRWQPGPVTGYAFATGKRLRDLGCTRGGCLDNCCLHKSRAKGLEPGRRQSSIVMYPLPGDPASIVILAYASIQDHLEALEGRRHEGSLYHVGAHNPRAGPQCRHVVKVLTAAQSQRIARPRPQCSPCRGLGCGVDEPAGVVRSDGDSAAVVDPRDLVVRAYEAALDFLELLLSGR